MNAKDLMSRSRAVTGAPPPRSASPIRSPLARMCRVTLLAEGAEHLLIGACALFFKKFLLGVAEGAFHHPAGCAWSLVRPIAMRRSGERADGSRTTGLRKPGKPPSDSQTGGPHRATPAIAGIFARSRPASAPWVAPWVAAPRGFRLRGDTEVPLARKKGRARGRRAGEASACSPGLAIGRPQNRPEGGVGAKTGAPALLRLHSSFRAAPLKFGSDRPLKIWRGSGLKILAATCSENSERGR